MGRTWTVTAMASPANRTAPGDDVAASGVRPYFPLQSRMLATLQRTDAIYLHTIHKMTAKKFLFLTILSSTFSIAAAASFHCTKAKTKTEKLICSTPEASAIDERLNATFKLANSRAVDKNGLRQSQRDWLADELKACSDSACIVQTMAARIALLDHVAPAGEAAARWTGHFVRYEHGKIDRDKATITILGMVNGQLHVAGDALWLGENEGQVNTGELRGDATTSKGSDIVQFDADGCTAQLTLRENALEVTNESGCGGMNVSFNGRYQRLK